MTFVSIKDAQLQLAELARRVQQGETIVVTQDGKPVLDLVPHEVGENKDKQSQPEKMKGGIDYEAGRAYLTSLGIADPFPYVADDFDEPLPEDFLLRPLPFD